MRSSAFAAFLLLFGLCVAWPWPLQKRATTFSGPSDPKRFKFYSTKNKIGIICDSDQGPDGVTLWYQDLGASVVGYVNYKTGVVKEFPIPWSKGSKRLVNTPALNNVTTLQCVMRLGKDGNLYGGAGIRNEIIRINPRTDPPQIRTFAPKNGDPAGNLQNFNDAWGANEGLWFSQTTADIVTLFEYKTHKFIDYKVPNKNVIPLNSPLGMRTDKHDNLWFTNFVGQYLSKYDKKTDKIVEYPNCCLRGLFPPGKGLFPEVLRSATSNLKYLWANSFGGGGYIRMDVTDPDKPKFKYFQNPEGLATFPFENVNDYCGRIWYTSPVRNNVYYYDPKIDKWTTVTVPVGVSGIPVSGSFEVTMHRGPGPYMWFTEGTVGRIVRYELDADCKGEPA